MHKLEGNELTMIFPFSLQRFILYLSYIGFSFILIYTNMLVFPNYNNDVLSLTVALILFCNAAYLFTSYLGINNKVRDKEVKVVFNDFVDQLRTELNPTVSNKTGDVKSSEVLEKLVTAKHSWRNKKKHDLDIYEQFERNTHLIFKINKLMSIIAIPFMLILGFTLLNQVSVWIMAPIHIVIGCLFLTLYLLDRKLRKNRRDLEDKIYPDHIKDLLNKVNNF